MINKMIKIIKKMKKKTENKIKMIKIIKKMKKKTEKTIN